jgi:hypothetical protein
MLLSFEAKRVWLEKIDLRMRRAAMYKACVRWCINATELRRKRSVLKKVEMRVRRAAMHKAWAWWCENATQRRQQSSLLEKVEMRVRRVGLHKASIGMGVVVCHCRTASTAKQCAGQDAEADAKQNSDAEQATTFM